MNNEGSISQHTVGKLLTRDFVLVFVAFFVFQVVYLALFPALPIHFTKFGSNESDFRP